MTTTPGPGSAGRIVVGVDGSALSDAALRWAAAEAERRHAPLHILHVFVYIPPIAGYAVIGPPETEELGHRVSEEAERAVRAAHPDLDVTVETRHGRAVPELVKASQGAAMVVVGARGHGRVTGMLIGSVSQQVAMHAACPVVVVRGTERLGSAPVVVGVDGSPESVAALRFALGHAAAAGVAVRAVRGEYVELPGGVPPGDWYTDLLEQSNQINEDIRAAIAEETRAVPGVEVELRIVRRHPVTTLVEESGDASLLVVASRGYGGFSGLLLGSVSQGVLSRADVPVAVVPRPEAAEERSD